MTTTATPNVVGLNIDDDLRRRALALADEYRALTPTLRDLRDRALDLAAEIETARETAIAGFVAVINREGAMIGLDANLHEPDLWDGCTEIFQYLSGYRALWTAVMDAIHAFTPGGYDNDPLELPPYTTADD